MTTFQLTDPEERKMIRERFLDKDGKLVPEAEVLYASEKGCVVRLSDIEVAIWENGRAEASIKKS